VVLIAQHFVGRGYRAAQVRMRRNDSIETDPGKALHDQSKAAVGQLEHLVDVCGGADRVEILLQRFFRAGLTLGKNADHASAGRRLIDQADGRFTRDRKRHEGIREQHRVPQRKKRQLGRNRRRVDGFHLELFGCLAGIVGHISGKTPVEKKKGRSRPRLLRPPISALEFSARAYPWTSRNSDEAPRRWDIIRSRCWRFSRASSQSLQRTANGKARSRRFVLDVVLGTLGGIQNALVRVIGTLGPHITDLPLDLVHDLATTLLENPLQL
jgi:hypothetical protein